MTARSLRDLEVWMVSAITGADADAADAHRVLLDGPRQAARDRFDVYRHGYKGRLVDCLRDDYPVLAEALGDARFEALGEAYVDRHPSRSPNLNVFGRHLAAFVREADVAGLDEVRGFAADLAALEWALVEVLHAETPPPLDAGALAAVPADAWDRARLVPSDAARLLHFDYPVNAFYQATRGDGAMPAIPGAEATHVVAYRKELTLWRQELTPPMAALLEGLFAALPLATALASVDVATLPQGAASIGAWFREWTAAGLFARVELGSP
ncbi:MAG TPA: DNA-binding domain-containing protein [Minicystis sp.]|nr:DNA-binding domain-containing protein [Minicystis sp.]